MLLKETAYMGWTQPTDKSREGGGRRWSALQMSLDGVPLLLRPGRGKEDLLCGCVRRLVSCVNGSMRELRSATLTSHSFTFSPRAHCCATSWSTWRRSRRSVLFPSTMTVTWGDERTQLNQTQFVSLFLTQHWTSACAELSICGMRLSCKIMIPSRVYWRSVSFWKVPIRCFWAFHFFVPLLFV